MEQSVEWGHDIWVERGGRGGRPVWLFSFELAREVLLRICFWEKMAYADRLADFWALKITLRAREMVDNPPSSW